MSDEDTIHVVMRFADGFMSSVDTVAEHQAVIKEHGAVWIGKLGKPLGEKSIERANRQCEDGVPTYLLLVQKAGRDYEACRGNVIAMARELPQGQKKLVPKYYDKNNLTPQITFWVKLSKIVGMKKGSLREYRIASSGRPLPSTLRKSMAGLFVIKEGEGIDY